MGNKFLSFLKTVGHDVKWFLDKILPYAASTGAVAISVFAPGLGPLYNATVQAVIQAEQSAVIVAQSGGTMTGQQKLEAVFKLVGPMISQGLKDAGKDGSDASVQAFINSVVLILDTAPALPTATA
jgi:hypothetical protein